MNVRVLKTIIVSGALVAVMASTSHATSQQQLIEGAKLCTRHLPHFERQYGIPNHLLSAIATTESGRMHETLGIKVPWPWTINAKGKSHYFKTKKEAIAKAKRLRANGTKSFDVGCMQVNLHHHGKAFTSLDQAFEPKHNIAYAASFLRDIYEKEKSWRKAATYYHSRTPKFGKRYVAKVYDNWYGILDKLRQAKRTVVGYNELRTASSQQVFRPDKPAYQPIRMNVVELSNKNRSRENGIMVIRPPRKNTASIPMAVETVNADTGPLEAKTNVINVAEIDAVQAAAITKKETPELKPFVRTTNTATLDGLRSGPTFIFTD